jgi:hypothetical protein
MWDDVVRVKAADGAAARPEFASRFGTLAVLASLRARSCDAQKDWKEPMMKAANVAGDDAGEGLAPGSEAAAVRPDASLLAPSQSAAGKLVGLAGIAVENLLAERKNRLADAVCDVMAEIRRSGRRFEGQEDWLADAIDKTTSKIRDVAERFRAAEIRDLVAQSRIFVRQRPGIFAAGVAVVTIAAARVAKHGFDEMRQRREAAAA